MHFGIQGVQPHVPWLYSGIGVFFNAKRVNINTMQNNYTLSLRRSLRSLSTKHLKVSDLSRRSFGCVSASGMSRTVVRLLQSICVTLSRKSYAVLFLLDRQKSFGIFFDFQNLPRAVNAVRDCNSSNRRQSFWLALYKRYWVGIFLFSDICEPDVWVDENGVVKKLLKYEYVVSVYGALPFFTHPRNGAPGLTLPLPRLLLAGRPRLVLPVYSHFPRCLPCSPPRVHQHVRSGAGSLE